ncbi:MAG: membrane protein insertion efficiency factor YidD [Marinobacter sp.]|uniref:membrane protein insertion efficiency factor YidD n=1 Tax=Marinobacter sp. TaxID=50741 RepID=UPI00299CDA10|nr:membrane protein insertion efficiency factor YidD [Marinobacter sp.]MDX1635099.1 membrane protein insertion efficiency factor YidD [Marinobacter sp.]
MRRLLVLPIRIYQYAISPMMASHCRHFPTCSAYAITAIERHGALKGLFLTLRRLLRCHPWSPGGYDPVPGTCHHPSACSSSQQTLAHADAHSASNQTTH